MSKNKPNLTIQGLIAEAKAFSDLVSHRRYANLYGVTDGKAIGTFIEQKFQSYLSRRMSSQKVIRQVDWIYRQ